MTWTPTKQSVDLMRERGFLVERVDRYDHRTRRAHDLWGWADLLAVGQEGVVAIQVTDKTNFSKRMKKVRASEKLPKVLAAGIRVEVHGWERGKEPRIEVVT